MRLLTAAKLIGSAFVFCLPIVAAQGCVVRLNDRNEPLVNGGVSGPAADCATLKPEPPATPGPDVKTKYVGRIDLKNPDVPQLDWSGGIMNARFDGTEVTWGAASPDPTKEKKEIIWEVVIDGAPPEQVILPDYRQNENAPITTKTHTLPAGVHEISVIRSSEAISGKVNLIPFKFGAGTKQLPPLQRARRIEYIGDSITCGYGIEGQNATCPYDVEIRPGVRIPVTQNIVFSYASQVAKALDADAVITCFSGKGVYLNYREANDKVISLQGARPDPDAETPIPKYWERLFAAPFDGPPAAEPWDFTKEPEPNVVFILLGQNDFARDVNQNSITDYQEAPIPGIARFDPGTFTVEYEKFVKEVRAKRPKAHIFLAVSPMMSDKFPIDDGRTIFRNTINAIVQNLNAGGDPKVYSIELVEMGVRYGLGCDYHPNLRVHEIMAEQVAGAIRSKTCW